MFPNSTDITIDNESNISSGTKSYMFDFKNGDLVVRDGKLNECDGIDAIKVWIEKILRTEKGIASRQCLYENARTKTLIFPLTQRFMPKNMSSLRTDVQKQKISLIKQERKLQTETQGKI